jgi:hypothetical protein
LLGFLEFTPATRFGLGQFRVHGLQSLAVRDFFDPDLAVERLFEALRLLVRGPHFQLGITDRLDLDADRRAARAPSSTANHAACGCDEASRQAKESGEDRPRSERRSLLRSSKPM